MKFLVAFALLAIAFANVESFRLREAPAPDIAVSVDYPYIDEIVQSPTPTAAQESSADVSSTANIVKVVDFVKGQLSTIGGVKPTFEDAEPLYDRTVKFVDEALNEEHVDNEILDKVVESPLEEAAPSDIAVKFVNEAVNYINDNESPLVKVVESPLEEAAPSDITVKFVDEAINDINYNESPLDKMVESPLEEAPLDKAVNFVFEAVNDINVNESPLDKVVESPLEEAPLDIAVNFVDEVENDLTDDESVNFANEAVNRVDSHAEIAPSFDSYAGIFKLINAAQEEKYVEGSSTFMYIPPEFMNVSTAVNNVENTVNMGHILAVGIEDSYEDSVDVHAQAEAYDDGILANVVRIAEFPRGKVYDNPMLR